MTALGQGGQRSGGKHNSSVISWLLGNWRCTWCNIIW